MDKKPTFSNGALFGIAWAIITSACVEPIEFLVPPADSQIVIEGMISDEEGPYYIKATKGIDINASSPKTTPIENLMITLYDDSGNSEEYVEFGPGEYRTNGLMKGTIGRSYHIKIETPDNRIFESIPDMLHPVGEIEEIKIEFEERKETKNGVLVPADVFNIFVDANVGELDMGYTRWRYKGTFKAKTVPELHMITSASYLPYKSPLPCSGYVMAAFVPGGRLLKVADCTCCECWGQHFEPVPQLSDVTLVSEGRFRNVKVGEVPINNRTFYEKYLVEIEQMSLSRMAFEFFRLIRSQKLGATSLFQPPSGEIQGNVRAINNNSSIIGIFWASSIKRRIKYIYPSDVPYLLTPWLILPENDSIKQFLYPDQAFYYYSQNVTRPCVEYFENATTVKPDVWE